MGITFDATGGDDNKGMLYITSQAWGCDKLEMDEEGEVVSTTVYLTNFALHVSGFKANVVDKAHYSKSADLSNDEVDPSLRDQINAGFRHNVFIDVFGTPLNNVNMRVGATFGTEYAKKIWDTTAADSATLQGRPRPVNPTILVQAYRENTGAGDAGYTQDTAASSQLKTQGTISDTQMEAWIGDANSGWRLNFADDANYVIENAKLDFGPIPYKSYDGGKDAAGNSTQRENFITDVIAIPKRVMDVTKLGDLDVIAIDESATVGQPAYADDDIYVDPANPATSALKSGFAKAADGTVTKDGVAVSKYRKVVIDGKYLRAVVGTSANVDQVADDIADGEDASALAAAAATMGITYDDAQGMLYVKAPAWGSEQLAYDTNGNIVSKLAYLSSFTLHFQKFSKGVTAGFNQYNSAGNSVSPASTAPSGSTFRDNLYVDVFGTANNKVDLNVSATFGTEFYVKAWNTTATNSAKLLGRPYPVRIVPTTQAYNGTDDTNMLDPNSHQSTANPEDYLDFASTSFRDSYVTENSTTTQSTYYSYGQSGYRVTLTNATKYDATRGGQLLLGDLTRHTLNHSILDYQTDKLVISRNLLFDPVNIGTATSVSLIYYTNNTGLDADATAPDDLQKHEIEDLPV